MARWLATWMVMVFLAGCAALPSAQERKAQADNIAARHDWQPIALHAGTFDMVAYVPRHIEKGERLTVYIEGDGLAWLAADMPSPDPTPQTPTGLQLALAQPSGNAAYLARPCQYLDEDKLAQCRQEYWTRKRFAPEVVAASNIALDDLKQRFGATHLTLVGYSGGGAIAALLATRRGDVEYLVTVAGNLDTRAWTDLHQVSPLSGSLNPADYPDTLRKIPQWHFAGEKDSVVPPFLVQNFANAMENAHVEIIPEYDHHCCWVEGWRELWKKAKH